MDDRDTKGDLYEYMLSKIEAKRLYESPYLDINPQGPEALFPSAQVDRMFQILEEFKKRTAA